MLRGVPVARPFPDVASHVIEAVSVAWVGADGGGRPVARVGSPGEAAVPVVGEALVVCLGLVAPGVGDGFEAATGGQLPLGLGRQRLTGPGGVCLRVRI